MVSWATIVSIIQIDSLVEIISCLEGGKSLKLSLSSQQNKKKENQLNVTARVRTLKEKRSIAKNIKIKRDIVGLSIPDCDDAEWFN